MKKFLSGQCLRTSSGNVDSAMQSLLPLKLIETDFAPTPDPLSTIRYCT